MKKFVIALLVAALLATGLASALAAGQVRTTGSVNLRTGPGLGYDKIDAVKKGTVLEYLDETSTDDRGVDWYKVAFNGAACWISSRYSKLESDGGLVIDDDPAVYTEPAPDAVEYDPEGEYIEISGYYLQDLAQTASALGLGSFREVKNSEVPNQYYNESLFAAGYDHAECFGLTGAGYTMFGVAIGMDVETAKSLMAAAGLAVYQTAWGVTFEHPSSANSLYDADGFDSCINVTLDANGRVAELDWSSYTG